MRKILRKGAVAFTAVFPMPFLLLVLLYIVWFGGNAALIGFLLYKIIRFFVPAF
ncbi:MAG: hypothetical protein WC495_01640 [Patescibacteria group bacterium]|jgi:hypothetical protein